VKNYLLAVTCALLFVISLAYAADVRDWHDLDAVHTHVQQAITEMEHARAANHYDMAGHGAKAEDLLRQAEHELKLSVDSAKQAK